MHHKVTGAAVRQLLSLSHIELHAEVKLVPRRSLRNDTINEPAEQCRTENMLEKLKESLERSDVVRFGEYQYFVHPITDGIPSMDPKVLQEVLDRMLVLGDFRCDYIVGAEAMAIPLMVPLSLQTGIPYNVVRKRKYGLPGEVSVHQTTGYSEKELFINGLKKGDRVVIVDDVLSTGGTLKAMVQAFKLMGVTVVDVIIVVQKTDRLAEMEAELGQKIKTLVRVEMRDGKVRVLS
ncbi:MAG: adenine phosphoribosyltransferase [Methanomassiliicoccales archaeon]|nr:adenine phosphoribosyltransferase [Methanomassiliicoccales archaeon]